MSNRYSGAKLKEIGDLFLLSDSGVTQASRRFEALMEADGQVEDRIKEIRKILDI